MKPIPRVEDEALGAVVAVVFDVVVFEDAEGFGGVVGAVGVGGVEDVAEFVAGESVEAGETGVEFCAELGAAVGIERVGRGGQVKRVAGMGAVPGGGDILRPRSQIVRGVGEFQNARDDEGEIHFRVGGWREDGELLFDVILEMRATDFLAGNEIMNQAVLIAKQTGRQICRHLWEHQEERVAHCRSWHD